MNLFPNQSKQSIIEGDCLDKMKEMADCSFDFIVTDPPYGLHFMGKQWDDAIPRIDIWEETLRICKPGAMLAAFGGSRTHHRLMCVIEDAGWEIRDCIFYLYGSGFPKSHNKFGLEGYGTALKPAYEIIIICMKPLDGTYKQNVVKWGIGGINIDDSRIETDEILSFGSRQLGNGIKYGKCIPTSDGIQNPQGRWPANIILDEEVAEELGEKSRYFYCAKASRAERNKGLEGMPLIECRTGCGGVMPIDDNGKDRDRFKKKAQNLHPTVKPIALMKYIIKLLAPPNNPTLLDPFMGSGSTLLAAKELGINAIGIEKQTEYCEIARARLNGMDQR